MNFSTDALETSPAPAPARREEPQTGKVHYTNEFHIYQKPRPNGAGVTKRARCNHCQGDWAYNETRLKNHITDPYRGCRRISEEARSRVRASDAPNPLPAPPPASAAASSAAVIPAPSPSPTPGPPVKRKREAMMAVAVAPVQNQGPVVPASSEPDILDGIGSTAEATPQSAQVHIALEFSMASGTLLRASWIASELLTEFHRDIHEVKLVPRSTENTFNIWIGGKIVWSRGLGQPPPDYDYLRPIFRAQCCNATL